MTLTLPTPSLQASILTDVLSAGLATVQQLLPLASLPTLPSALPHLLTASV